ncbi:MAG: nucleoside hydrolase, partial [Niameybacter sp.]
MERRKVIIDCDPGIDDALALLLAIKSEELEVVGITVCSGNVPARMGAKNALKVLALCGKTDIPVYVGEEVPLVRELVTAQDTHGEDGLGERFYEVLE